MSVTKHYVLYLGSHERKCVFYVLSFQMFIYSPFQPSAFKIMQYMVTAFFSLTTGIPEHYPGDIIGVAKRRLCHLTTVWEYNEHPNSLV